MSKEKKRYWLTFGVEQTDRPLLWEMSRKFDLIFNIRNASVRSTIALLAVELEGPGATIERAVRWFKRKGIRVDPVELSAIEG